MNVLYPLRRAARYLGSNIGSHSAEGPLTWTEVADRAYRGAAWLRDLGFQKGDRLAVWMLNSHDYLELYYATAIAGIVIVPLNTRWHESDVAFTINDAEALGLVVEFRLVVK